jgi:L,D-peptidoglycan transpeptidase YkuD (ErfK/YbiS/YcfS/YnhG family)
MGFPKRKAVFRTIRVRAAAGHPQRGWLTMGGLTFPVALGRSGIIADKREGDGGTPRGAFHPLRVWYRTDRMPRPATMLPVRAIASDDAWCEDPSDRRYNRPMRWDGTGDRLVRDDHLYDMIIEIDHNTRPRVAGRGSAVFIHLARPGLAPTAGCIAMPHGRLRRLVAGMGPATRIEIG